MSKVMVTGLGFATCIGTGREEVLASLRAMRHGFSRRRLAGEDIGPEIVCGTVAGFELADHDCRFWKFPGSVDLDHRFLAGLPPHGAYAYVATEEARQQAGLSFEDLRDPAVGLFGASQGSPRALRNHLNQMEKSGWQRIHPRAVVSSVAGTLNFNLATFYGITGANCGFVSACTSSSHALGYAFDEIALGRQELMIVTGAQDGNAEDILPFLGMGALSRNLDPDRASRPFDRQRDGFVASGGGATVILESAGRAARRGCPPLAEMRGWGQASDGHEVAAPHPGGRGIHAAMERCLAVAGVTPRDLDWINAHATSTPSGDRAELTALSLLGTGDTPVSSTKGLTGHGLAFSGLLEAALSILAIQEGLVPGNAALEEPDAAGERVNLPTRTGERPVRLVLNNSSGFGGSNVCHLFSQP